MMVSPKDQVGALWQRLSAHLRRSLQPSAAPVAHEEGPLTSWSPAGRAYFQRWLVIGALIGVVAGVGSIVFYAAIAFCTHLFLGLGAGFVPPGPAGEGTTVIQSDRSTLAHSRHYHPGRTALRPDRVHLRA